MYFGYLDNNNRCYTAPERWLAVGQTAEPDAVLKPSMDVFSGGCVIAEILMDGAPLFDLAGLKKYKRGEFDPSPKLRKYKL